MKRFVLGVLVLIGLAGCGSLPDDGPGAKIVEKRAGPLGAAGYSVIDLDYQVAETIESISAPTVAGLVAASSEAPTDLISDGDVISVTVFEAGAAPLFSRGSSALSMSGSETMGAIGAQTQDTIPRMVVDGDGAVFLPYAGRVEIAGLTPERAGAALREALIGRAVDPQVMVNVLSSAKNSVSVLGEVRTPGRFLLSANNDHLLDVIAEAGGPTRPRSDIQVVLVRGDQSFTAPLSILMDDPAQNIRLAPHDQVRLVLHERKYSTFGALGRVTETPITVEHVSLSSAISAGGGLDTYSADNSAVFIFRFERPDVARALGVQAKASAKGVPIVYHLDMRDPNSFFFASSFEIRPDDMVFVPRASSIGVKKFLDLVSVVTNVAYTAAVTSANTP